MTGAPAAAPDARPASGGDETAALAQGGRTSFFGFLLRLAGRLPFLFIAGRFAAYGPDALGRFAYATMVVELMAQLATLGLRRGLAAELAKDERPQAHVVADALVLAWGLALAGALLLIAVPWIVFPARDISGFDRLFPLIVLSIVTAEVALAALAFRRDIAATVRARSLVEPWTLTLAAAALALTGARGDGLIIAYALSMVAAMVAALWPLFRAFGWPRGWVPQPRRLLGIARANLPLAGADVADWGSRRLDVFILGRFASAEIIGIYYVAQQVASLPQKLKTSFDPILAPVLTAALARDDLAGVAGHVRQIGFWLGAVQLGVVLALGLTGRAILGLFGPAFASGAGVLALLLVVELFAAQAAVAESALVYVRRVANLLVSAAGLVVQVAVTLLFVEAYGGLAAAGGLAVAALLLSVAKTRLLRGALGHPVSGWRVSLLAGGAAAFAAGLGVQRLPEYLQLTVGLAAILGVFGGIVWRFGFKGADRLLFPRAR